MVKILFKCDQKDFRENVLDCPDLNIIISALLRRRQKKILLWKRQHNCFEDGGRGCKSRNVRNVPVEDRKGKETLPGDSALEAP